MATLLLISPALAESQPTSPTSKIICFSEDDGAKMLITLENSDKQKEIISLLKQENEQLTLKAKNLQDIITLQEKQLATANETINKLNELMATQKKAYEEQIEKVKPSIWSYIGTAIGSLAVGLAIGLLL